MALITINAVVDIPAHFVVLEIGRVIATMTTGALEHRIVVGIGMARRTDAVGVPVINWELRVLSMVESCARPGSRIVAALARIGEVQRLRRVARVGRVLIISLVATIASRW